MAGSAVAALSGDHCSPSAKVLYLDDAVAGYCGDESPFSSVWSSMAGPGELARLTPVLWTGITRRCEVESL